MSSRLASSRACLWSDSGRRRLMLLRVTVLQGYDLEETKPLEKRSWRDRLDAELLDAIKVVEIVRDDVLRTRFDSQFEQHVVQRSVPSYLQSMIDRSPRDREPQFETDPVIEAYKRDIDRTLLRENLRKSVEERLAALVALQHLAEEARR